MDSTSVRQKAQVGESAMPKLNETVCEDNTV